MFSFLWCCSFSILIPDPDFKEAFYLNNTGQYNGHPGEDLNVISAWEQGYDGQGIHIRFLTTGMNPRNLDLEKGLLKNHSWNFKRDNFYIDLSSPEELKRGNSFIGIAAARKNSFSTIGIAYNSKFSVFVPSEECSNHFLRELKNLKNDTEIVDIFADGIVRKISLSPNKRKHYFIDNEPAIDSFIKHISTKGRNGKGSIFVGSSISSHPRISLLRGSDFIGNGEVIAVSGSTNRGDASSESMPFSGTLVNAPIHGSSNPNDTIAKYAPIISSSGWSSSKSVNTFEFENAASMVAGIVALMLEANENLSARDVRHILVLTSQINDQKSVMWRRNAAGYLFNPILGFGRVDAGLAVNVSKNWIPLPPEVVIIKSAEGKFRSNGARREPLIICFDINENDDLTVEYLYVKFSTPLSPFALHVHVLSPSGTEKQIHFPISSDLNVFNARIPVRGFFGEFVNGKWYIKFTDFSLDGSYFSNISIEFHGSKGRTKFVEYPRRMLKPRFRASDPILSINVSGTATCEEGVDITMNFKGNKKYFEIGIPIYFRNPLTGSMVRMGGFHQNTAMHFDVPCSLDSPMYEVIAEIVELGLSCTRYLTVQSSRAPGVFSPDQYAEPGRIHLQIATESFDHMIGSTRQGIVIQYDKNGKPTRYTLVQSVHSNYYLATNDEDSFLVMHPILSANADPCVGNILAISTKSNKKKTTRKFGKYCPVTPGLEAPTINNIGASLGLWIVCLVLVIGMLILALLTLPKNENVIDGHFLKSN